MDEDIKKSVLKTGTTTLGIVCKDGIVLAADKRATYGGNSGVSYIADKEMDKILEVTPNIITTIAGTASDAYKLVRVIRAELKLKELKSKSKPTIKIAANLFATISYQNIRQPSMIPSIAHFLVAGYDKEGIHFYDVTPDGNAKEVKTYSSTGSGMVNCNPILDSEYKENLTLEEGIKLVRKCINAAIGRDPASGEGIDIYTITKDEIKQVAAQKIEPTYVDYKE